MKFPFKGLKTQRALVRVVDVSLRGLGGVLGAVRCAAALFSIETIGLGTNIASRYFGRFDPHSHGCFGLLQSPSLTVSA